MPTRFFATHLSPDSMASLLARCTTGALQVSHEPFEMPCGTVILMISLFVTDFYLSLHEWIPIFDVTLLACRWAAMRGCLSRCQKSSCLMTHSFKSSTMRFLRQVCLMGCGDMMKYLSMISCRFRFCFCRSS